MILSAVITTLFLSPLLFILVIAAGALLAARGRKRAGRAAMGAAALVLLLASIEPVHDALLLPLENRYPALPLERTARYDAVIVLGGGIIDRSAELGGHASLFPESLKRLAYGIMLARRGDTPLFVSGGRVWARNVESEAEAAQRTAAELGFPSAMIRVEDKSRTTWENAGNLAPLLHAAGVSHAALVTSAYHMPRSVLAFSKAGISVVPAPTDYKTDRARYDLRSFLPSFQTLAESFQAVREYLGLVQYRIRP